MARGGLAEPPPKLNPKTPPDISLLRAKNGLDNGVHFSRRQGGGGNNRGERDKLEGNTNVTGWPRRLRGATRLPSDSTPEAGLVACLRGGLCLLGGLLGALFLHRLFGLFARLGRVLGKDQGRAAENQRH